MSVVLAFLFGIFVGAVGLGAGSVWLYHRAKTARRSGANSIVCMGESVCAVLSPAKGKARTIRGVA